MKAGAMIHVAGMGVQFAGRIRQRCSWCGAVLIDLDASGIDDPTDYLWPKGVLVIDDGEEQAGITHTPGHPMPEQACLLLPHEITGSRT